MIANIFKMNIKYCYVIYFGKLWDIIISIFLVDYQLFFVNYGIYFW